MTTRCGPTIPSESHLQKTVTSSPWTSRRTRARMQMPKTGRQPAVLWLPKEARVLRLQTSLCPQMTAMARRVPTARRPPIVLALRESRILTAQSTPMVQWALEARRVPPIPRTRRLPWIQLCQDPVARQAQAARLAPKGQTVLEALRTRQKATRSALVISTLRQTPKVLALNPRDPQTPRT